MFAILRTFSSHKETIEIRLLYSMTMLPKSSIVNFLNGKIERQKGADDAMAIITNLVLKMGVQT